MPAVTSRLFSYRIDYTIKPLTALSPQHQPLPLSTLDRLHHPLSIRQTTISPAEVELGKVAW